MSTASQSLQPAQKVERGGRGAQHNTQSMTYSTASGPDLQNVSNPARTIQDIAKADFLSRNHTPEDLQSLCCHSGYVRRSGGTRSPLLFCPAHTHTYTCPHTHTHTHTFSPRFLCHAKASTRTNVWVAVFIAARRLANLPVLQRRKWCLHWLIAVTQNLQTTRKARKASVFHIEGGGRGGGDGQTRCQRPGW